MLKSALTVPKPAKKPATLPTPEQALLAKNFAAAMSAKGAPTPGVIAEACEVTEQAVSNWKRTGKITKQNLAIVSRLTGWSVERLLGQKDGLKPAEPAPRGWPFPGIAPKLWDDLTPDQRKEIQGMVRDWIERFRASSLVPKSGYVEISRDGVITPQIPQAPQSEEGTQQSDKRPDRSDDDSGHQPKKRAKTGRGS